MAPSGPRDDEDAPDPVEAADEQAPEEDELEGFTVDDDEDLPFEDDEGFTAGDDLEAARPATEESTPPEAEEGLPALLDDEEGLAEVVAAVDDEDDEDDDVVREGEFICRSCFMAKRDSALADEDAMLCRDCVA